MRLRFLSTVDETTPDDLPMEAIFHFQDYPAFILPVENMTVADWKAMASSTHACRAAAAAARRANVAKAAAKGKAKAKMKTPFRAKRVSQPVHDEKEFEGKRIFITEKGDGPGRHLVYIVYGNKNAQKCMMRVEAMCLPFELMAQACSGYGREFGTHDYKGYFLSGFGHAFCMEEVGERKHIHSIHPGSVVIILEACLNLQQLLFAWPVKQRERTHAMHLSGVCGMVSSSN